MYVLLFAGPSAHETLCVTSKSGLCFLQPCGAPTLNLCLSSRLNALGVLSSGRPSACVLGGCFYVGTFLCSLCGLLFFFFFLAAFSIDVCHVFLQCMLSIIPLMGGMMDVVVTRVCTGY